MNIKEIGIIHNLPLEQQYAALDIFINSRSINSRSVTHNDIIKIGKRLKELISQEHTDDKTTNEYLDNEINKICVKLQKEHELEMENITNTLMDKNNQELDNTKKKYEELIDRISEIHIQSEIAKLNAQQRKLEQIMNDKLEQQALELEKQKVKEMEEDRGKYFQMFTEQFQFKIHEAVETSRNEQQNLFNREKQELIEELDLANKKRERMIVKQLKQKFENAETNLKSRYRDLYNEYETRCIQYGNLEQDYQQLQMDFQRFIDSTEGHFRSDYLLKLRSHSIERCEEKLRDFQSTLTRPLLSPDIFEGYQ